MPEKLDSLELSVHMLFLCATLYVGKIQDGVCCMKVKLDAAKQR